MGREIRIGDRVKLDWELFKREYPAIYIGYRKFETSCWFIVKAIREFDLQVQNIDTKTVYFINTECFYKPFNQLT